MPQMSLDGFTFKITLNILKTCISYFERRLEPLLPFYVTFYQFSHVKNYDNVLDLRQAM